LALRWFGWRFKGWGCKVDVKMEWGEGLGFGLLWATRSLEQLIYKWFLSVSYVHLSPLCYCTHVISFAFAQSFYFFFLFSSIAFLYGICLVIFLVQSTEKEKERWEWQRMKSMDAFVQKKL